MSTNQLPLWPNLHPLSSIFAASRGYQSKRSIPGNPLVTSRGVFQISHNSANEWKVWRLEMNRRGNGRFFGRRRGDKKDKKQNNERPSVHTRNLYLFAAPLLLILGLLRHIALQLWVVLGLVVCKSRNLGRSRGSYQQANRCPADAESGMTSNTKKNTGPGEPVLATQKHHHRKAFEYISKALKIDEEDAGALWFILNEYDLCNYTPRKQSLGGVYRNHPVCLSVCSSVRLSVQSKLNLGYNFSTNTQLAQKRCENILKTFCWMCK